MNFAAPYDRITKFVSALSCLVLLAAGLATRNLFVGAISLALIFVAYAYSPRGYVISEGALLIQRLAGTVRMPLLDLREARPATQADFRGCRRVWGSGGLFGYYGRFRTATLGPCTWYVTDRSRAVVARFREKTVLLSPGDVASFLETIRPFAPSLQQAAGAPPEMAAMQSRGVWKLVGIAIAVAVAGVAVTLGVLANFYAPGPPGYTLTSDALTIHDRFYPMTLRADQVDVAAIRVVDLARDTEWRPVRRTNGFANAHYQSGWFRAANGKTMRMYSAGASELVLLPPKGDEPPVLIEVRDPEGFVEELRQAWQGR